MTIELKFKIALTKTGTDGTVIHYIRIYTITANPYNIIRAIQGHVAEAICVSFEEIEGQPIG